MSEVEWRKIPYLPERYEASSDGRIRRTDREVKVYRKSTGGVSIRRIPGGEVKASVRKGGKSRGTHPVITVAGSPDDEKTYRLGETRLCILIARTFHGCPYVPGDRSGRQNWRVMHRDGNPCNNAADNLEWVCSNSDRFARSQYERNLLRLEELREEPVEDWIKRIWGEVSA